MFEPLGIFAMAMLGFFELVAIILIVMTIWVIIKGK